MKHRIVLRPAADRDLIDQADYLAGHESLRTGLRFLDAAEKTFRLIASQPEMGTQTECRSPHLHGMRMFPVKRFPNHLIFYRVVKDGVEIVRVMHGARDIETLLILEEEGPE